MLKLVYACFTRAICVALFGTFFAAGTAAALAAPIYHVAVDTSAWSGNGYLDLTLAGLENAPPVTATVSNFRGSFGGASATRGQVAGGVASAVTLVQGPSFNELLQQIDFGGMFWFDVSFAVPTGVPGGWNNGSNFGVALVNADQTAYAAGLTGDIATIALYPGAAPVLLADGRFVSIAEVPEPGSVALVGLGLGLLLAGRRRTRGGRGMAPH